MSRHTPARPARLLAAATLLALALPLQGAWRDPFWPIGWEPPKPKAEEPPQPVEAPKEEAPAEAPKPPPPKPSDIAPLSLWLEARGHVKISGQSRARGADGQMHQVIYVDGKGYSAGDTLSLDYQAYRFTWRLREGSDQQLLLKPLKSVRIAAADETPTTP